jgi:hypothetical protein
MALNVEQALRTIRERAAVLRFLSDSASQTSDAPDSAVLSGIGDVCADIERLTRRVTDVLGVEALGLDLPPLEDADLQSLVD